MESTTMTFTNMILGKMNGVSSAQPQLAQLNTEEGVSQLLEQTIPVCCTRRRYIFLEGMMAIVVSMTSTALILRPMSGVR